MSASNKKLEQASRIRLFFNNNLFCSNLITVACSKTRRSVVEMWLWWCFGDDCLHLWLFLEACDIGSWLSAIRQVQGLQSESKRVGVQKFGLKKVLQFLALSNLRDQKVVRCPGRLQADRRRLSRRIPKPNNKNWRALLEKTQRSFCSNVWTLSLAVIGANATCERVRRGTAKVFSAQRLSSPVVIVMFP